MSNASPLLDAPLGPTMLRLSIPGVIGALLTTTPALVEAAFLKESGAQALAAVALVYPIVILSGMFSAGAFGGAVSGFIARAVGAGDMQQASGVLVCASLISIVGGTLMWLLLLGFGPLIYMAASDNSTVVDSAHYYARLLFPVMPAYWLINMLSSVLRGSGDMVRPALVAAVLLGSYCLFAWLLIPLKDASTLDSIHGAAFAMAGSYLVAAALVVGFVLLPSQPIRFRLGAFRMNLLLQILKQGSLAATQSIMTVVYALVTTIIFSRYGTDWLAGFGLAVRLELIMVPVIFGIGASMIAIVGAYVGAGRRSEAIAIAWRGIAVNVILIGVLGLLLTLFPGIWCTLVGSDAAVIGSCNRSLQVVAPTYVFFALGLSCYLISQALNTLAFPVLGALVRLLIVASGLYWMSATTAIDHALYLVALAAVAYGVVVAAGLRAGPWRRRAAAR